LILVVGKPGGFPGGIFAMEKCLSVFILKSQVQKYGKLFVRNFIQFSFNAMNQVEWKVE
jgi:hypothetical protein